MRSHPFRLRACCASVFLLGITSGALAAEPTGDRYRVTTRFEVPGMPFQMPSQSSEVCTAKGGGSESMVPRDDNCTVSDFKLSGGKASFRFECTGKDAVSGDGETEMLGADAYSGRIRAVSRSGSETMDMTIRFDGKRIGGCDYRTESPEAMGNALVKQTCDAQVSNTSAYKMFIGPRAPCATQRAAYCANVTREATRMENPAHYPEHDIAVPWQGFEGCGRPRAGIVAKACARAGTDGNLMFVGAHCPDALAQACSGADPRSQGTFVATYCPAQASAAAAQHCQGRGYTAMSTSPYRDFCGKQASARLQQRMGGDADDQSTPDAPAAAPAAKSGLRDRLKALKDKVGGD